MPNTDLINPKTLRDARKRQRLTQQQLADAIKCSKDTVSRWERGTSRRVRSHLRKPLCDTLRVSWEKLTGPDDQSEVPVSLGWTKIPFKKNIRAALHLVALRYDIHPHDVLDLAPLLFVIAAEQSLLWRKRHLEEIDSTWREAEEKLFDYAGHLGGIIAVRTSSADDQLHEEEKSLSQRDVFGRSIRYEHWTEGDEGPFLHYIRGLVKDLPDGAVTSIESNDGDMIESYQIAEDTLEQYTGLSGNEEQTRKIFHYIRNGSINLNACIRAKRDSSESDYQQWLSNELERAEESRREELLEIFGPDGLTFVDSAVAGGKDTSGMEEKR